MTNEQESPTPQEAVKRREDRNPTNWIATIRLRDGTEIPCNVKDVSKSGARIGVPAARVLPDTFMLRIIGRDFLCLVKLAWRRGNYAGVRIERVGKIPPASAAPPEPASKRAEAVLDRPEPVAPGGVGIRSRKRSLAAF